jgi:uncharacterized protein (DUF433 family)
MIRLTFEPELPPLTQLQDGTIRVANTRVTLDSVLHSFHSGATAETVVVQFPVLDLADVCAVFAYYLRHRERVDVYLGERVKEADAIHADICRNSELVGMRERLSQRTNIQRSTK